MKLSCKRIDFTYTPGEEIFNFPEESGLPFIFDVEEELTGDPAVMDAVGEMLDEAEKLAEKAKAAIKAALADEDSRYHSVVTFFMEFHRDDVGPDRKAAEQGEFDILLVFMYDRLGRNLNETPFIAEWFTKKGIHVWSVYEGEIIDGVDAERMLDYIRFWQTDEAQKL